MTDAEQRLSRGWCPETVMVPPGTFLMGSPEDESARLVVESPQRVVTIEKAFAVGKFAVTVGQFAAFIADSGYPVGTTCKQWNGTEWQEQPGSFRSPDFPQTGTHPVVCVSWDDAQAYVSWLSAKSGRRYRLLSEAEWEYAARAGTATPYSWGTSITSDQANYNDGIDGARRQQTMSADSFEPNPWGLYQMHGNIWEWVEDCWSRSYHGAPTDGNARQIEMGSEQRVLRGGSWLNSRRGLRSARRHAADRQFRRSDVGFRVAVG